MSQIIRVYTRDRRLYMEANSKTGLVHVFESKGDKLLEIISLRELKTYMESKA